MKRPKDFAYRTIGCEHANEGPCDFCLVASGDHDGRQFPDLAAKYRRRGGFHRFGHGDNRRFHCNSCRLRPASPSRNR